MKLTTQKKLAAQVMKVGKSRVWMNPEFEDEASLAITKGDIRRLVDEGAIQSRQKTGVSRGRARVTMRQKRMGRQIGPGRRKGKSRAVITGKQRWTLKIRPQRRELKRLRDEGKITSGVYRQLYLKAKGNSFRNTAHLKSYIAENRLGVSK